MIHFEIPENPSSIIKLIGVGGGGGNAINHMFNNNDTNVEYIICNTDSQSLSSSPVNNKIQLGPYLTQGLGAGANPEVGEKAAEESLDELKRILEVNTKMVFITAGMGGGTGTGGAPIIAKLCQEMGLLTVAIVTTPFFFEGKKRMRQALEGIEKLKKHVDTIVIISNDKLREQCGDMSFLEAFSKADDILKTAASCITNVIHATGQINTDFADVNTVMRKGGVAILGNASVSGENRALRATEEALNSPLLNNQEIHGANWILLNITSSSTHAHTMDELSIIQGYVQDQAGDDCEVILGMGIDDTLGEDISVTIIATGFQQKEIEDRMSAIQMQKAMDSRVVMNLEDKKEETEPIVNSTVENLSNIQTENENKIIVSLDEEIESSNVITVGNLFEEPKSINQNTDDITLHEKLTKQFTTPTEQYEPKLIDPAFNSEQEAEDENEEMYIKYGIPKVKGIRTLTSQEREDLLNFELQKEHLEQRANGLLGLKSDLSDIQNHSYLENVPAIERQGNPDAGNEDKVFENNEDFLSGYNITHQDISNNKLISSINSYLYGNKPD